MTGASRHGWRALAGIVLRLVGVGIGLLVAYCGLAVANGLGLGALGSEVSDHGSATVLRCRDEGFLEKVTMGELWRCELDIRWESGRRERAVGELTQFTGEDAGHRLRVQERQIWRGKSGIADAVVYREEFAPRPLLFYIAVLAVALLVGLAPAMMCAMTASRRIAQLLA